MAFRRLRKPGNMYKMSCRLSKPKKWIIEITLKPIEKKMISGLNELIEILSAEQKIYQQYLQLLTEQQECLIKNDLDAIRESTEKINTLAQQATNLENGRQKIIARLSNSAEIKFDDINISKLIEKFAGPGFGKLEQLKDTIMEMHEQVTRQKTRNELLIDQSMGIISQTIQFIHEVNNPRVVYENPAKLKGGAGNNGALISRMM
jgi:hypothetical protein